MAQTLTITCPAGISTFSPEGSLTTKIDKIPCPATPYSIRHEVGVMTGFIALFIIASIAYGIASKSESPIIDYSPSEIFYFSTLPHRGRLLISGAKEREERGARGEGGPLYAWGLGDINMRILYWKGSRGGGWLMAPNGFHSCNQAFSNAFLNH